jgi:hypothetical protein
MSYILDALERAQAQRTQGQVPDLYVRQSIAAAPIGNRDGRSWRSMLALGAAATLGALALGAWLWRPPAVEPAAPPAAVRAPNPVAMAEPLSPPAKPAFHSKATARARAGQSTGTTPSETGGYALRCPHRGPIAGRIARRHPASDSGSHRQRRGVLKQPCTALAAGQWTGPVAGQRGGTRRDAGDHPTGQFRIQL